MRARLSATKTVFARRALIALLLAHACGNALRSFLAVRQDAALADATTLSMPAGALAVFGALWAVLFGTATALVYAQRSGAARVSIGIAVVYQASWWLIIAVSARASDVWQRSLFLIVWSMLVIALTVFLARQIRRTTT